MQTLKDAVVIIKSLVDLKDHKDRHGKDGYYNEMQPLRWIAAKKFLDEYNSSSPPYEYFANEQGDYTIGININGENEELLGYVETETEATLIIHVLNGIKRAPK